MLLCSYLLIPPQYDPLFPCLDLAFFILQFDNGFVSGSTHSTSVSEVLYLARMDKKKKNTTLTKSSVLITNLPFLFPTPRARLKAVWPSLFVAVKSAPCSKQIYMIEWIIYEFWLGFTYDLLEESPIVDVTINIKFCFFPIQNK